MIILKPVECAVLQWACLLPPQQSLPLWEYSFDTKRKMEELGSSQETGYRTMTPSLRTGYCQSSTACLRVTRVERAPFHMMCEEDNWPDSCLQVKKKKKKKKTTLTLKSLRGTSKSPIISTPSHAAMLAQPPVITQGWANRAGGWLPTLSPTALRNRTHTQSTHYKPHVLGRTNRKYQQNPKNAQVPSRSHEWQSCGFETACSCPDQTIRGSRPGKGLSLPRLWGGQQSPEIHPMS